MSRRLPLPLVLVLGLLGAVLAPPFAAAQNDSRPARTRISVWDTRQPAARELSASALADHAGWTRITRNQQIAAFQGDAVIGNGRITAVVRKQGQSVSLYSHSPAGAIARSQLRLLTTNGAPAQQLSSVALTEHTRSSVRLTVSFLTEDKRPVNANLRLKRGAVSLEIEPGEGAGRVHVGCPGRFVVLPDFFADDILLDARKLPGSAIRIPSENFLLHLTGGGEALTMCVFENRDQDVKVTLSGTGRRRIITGSEIDFGQGSKIWVALLAAPQVWHALEVAPQDANQIKSLEWRMPFAAQWRINFTRPNQLTDSWEFLLPAGEGNGYLKPNWMTRGAKRIGADRKRWTTVLGRFEYPCWTDAEGRGYLQPLRHKALSFDGAAVIYPLCRVEQTPTDRYTVVDVMRNCLGVGPCEYILNVEGQKQHYMGRATCSARDALKAIYADRQQRQKTEEIEAALDDALTFVTHIRGRISQYVEFGQELRSYLAQQQKAHPELSEFVAQLDAIASELDARVEARRQEIRTPKFVADMNTAFRKNLLGYDGPDVEKRLTEYTSMLTQIGGNQDELVGECRWIVRSLRQRAGILMAGNSAYAEVAQAVRAKCQQILLKPSTYEGVRH